MATSYSSFSLTLGVPHRTWKEGDKGSYTLTPPCPSWIKWRLVLKGVRGHRETTHTRAPPPVRFGRGWARARGSGNGGLFLGKSILLFCITDCRIHASVHYGLPSNPPYPYFSCFSFVTWLISCLVLCLHHCFCHNCCWFSAFLKLLKRLLGHYKTKGFRCFWYTQINHPPLLLLF